MDEISDITRFSNPSKVLVHSLVLTLLCISQVISTPVIPKCQNETLVHLDMP